MKLLAVLTGCNDFIEAGDGLKREGGTVAMCQVIQAIKRDGREEGREEGRKEGRKEGKMELLAKFVRRGILSMSEAAKEVDMDIDSFEKRIKGM